ncbi:hypothetical protein LTR12_012402 [Friedmanniomyces endolithicus]|nr:hypothetical protein LTR12_012402 [Friedmanniomyces endolithicus]
MGSIAYAPRYTFAPAHAYKISKAAMNTLNAQYALKNAEEGFAFVAISPGSALKLQLIMGVVDQDRKPRQASPPFETSGSSLIFE